jgi:UDP-N-acetylmuramate dehydrogenase
VPASAGALIDRAGLKGTRIGGARVSTTHANFIVNEGGARAADILALIRLCQREVFAQFGIRLREEIVLLGTFDE